MLPFKRDEIISTDPPRPREALRQAILAQLGSQRLAAYALGISESHLSSIINGWIPPGRDLAQRASKLLGRPVDELFPGR